LTSTYRIPMSEPDLTDAERSAVAAVLQTSSLSMGIEISRFEETFTRLTRLKHAIGVNSGTAGLHLCIRAAGINPGDLVITTPFSFVASTNVLLYEKAIPVFVDIDPLTGNMDVKRMRQVIIDLLKVGKSAMNWLPRSGVKNPGTLKAILPVDVFGQPADMDPIMDAAKEYGLIVIEDSCEALGAKYKERPAGSLGNYGVFAFYPNKQITSGEGGMIVTDDDQAASFMRALRNQGRAPGDSWLQHSYLGYNYRLDEMSSALGRVQMSRLDDLLAKRERVAEWYNQRLSLVAEVELPKIIATTTQMSWFVYVIRLIPGINRDQIETTLGVLGIPARRYFNPIHLQPYVMEKFGYRQGEFPVTEDVSRRSLSLPFSSVMTESQVETVCEAITEALKRGKQ